MTLIRMITANRAQSNKIRWKLAIINFVEIFNIPLVYNTTSSSKYQFCSCLTLNQFLFQQQELSQCAKYETFKILISCQHSCRPLKSLKLLRYHRVQSQSTATYVGTHTNVQCTCKAFQLSIKRKQLPYNFTSKKLLLTTCVQLALPLTLSLPHAVSPSEPDSLPR